MKNKKGFTLIELLAVIVILGIITSISVVSVNSIKKKQEAENRRNVISGILTAARRFSVDHPEKIKDKQNVLLKYIGRIYIEDLILYNYLEIDENKYPFFLYETDDDGGISSTKRYVDLMLCSTDSNSFVSVKTYFQFYDRKQDRSKFKNKDNIPYNDCGCDEQTGTAKKLCGILNGKDIY